MIDLALTHHLNIPQLLEFQLTVVKQEFYLTDFNSEVGMYKLGEKLTTNTGEKYGRVLFLKPESLASLHSMLGAKLNLDVISKGD